MTKEVYLGETVSFNTGRQKTYTTAPALLCGRIYCLHSVVSSRVSVEAVGLVHLES